MGDTVKVTVDNFVRAESNRMMTQLMAGAGGINRWQHNRVPTPLDQQTVVRMNRDTLYSFAVVDLAEGATVTMPDSGDRYAVADGGQPGPLHQPGHPRARRAPARPRPSSAPATCCWRCASSPTRPTPPTSPPRTPSRTASPSPPVRRTAQRCPDYDEAVLRRGARRARSSSVGPCPGTERMFGRRETVDPVRHLIGTAIGWGGLPEQEANYLIVEPGLPVGEYRIVVARRPGRRVLVDLALQRRRLLRAERPRRLQRQPAHRASRSPTARSSSTSAAAPTAAPTACAHGRLELHGPALPTSSGDLDGSWTFPTVQPVS